MMTFQAKRFWFWIREKTEQAYLMSPAGDAEKAKTRLAAIMSLKRPVLMSWAWIFLRSFMLVHLVSSKERHG